MSPRIRSRHGWAPATSRITTRYIDGSVESLLSSLHEYGHALYERQIDPALERTNLGHRHVDVDPRVPEQAVGEPHRAQPGLRGGARRGARPGAASRSRPRTCTPRLSASSPSPIRVSADPLTYPLHIILRFELELALIGGELAVADLPGAWRDGMRRLLGIEVPSDALGCLQDVHWGAGSFGYFPSYALGCLIAAQLWETIEADLGARDEDLRRGEVAAIQGWLGEHVHRYGRRIDTAPLVEHATGRPLEVEPFIRYVAPLAGL